MNTLADTDLADTDGRSRSQPDTDRVQGIMEFVSRTIVALLCRTTARAYVTGVVARVLRLRPSPELGCSLFSMTMRDCFDESVSDAFAPRAVPRSCLHVIAVNTKLPMRLRLPQMEPASSYTSLHSS